MVVGEDDLGCVRVVGVEVNGRIGGGGGEHVGGAEGAGALEQRVEAGEVALLVGGHAAEGGAEFEAAGKQADEGEHGAAGIGIHTLEGFAVGVIAEDAAVLVPAQAHAGGHFRLEVGGVEPDALEIDDACGDIEHGGAVFAEVAFVDESTRAEPFAAEFEDLAVGGGGGVGFIMEPAGGNPCAFRVVELNADQAVLGHALPHREGVGLEVGVGEIEFHPGHVVAVLGVEAGDVAAHHPLRVGESEVVRRHVRLDVGERNAAEFAELAVELGEGFVRRGERSVFRPHLVVPPSLLGVAVVPVAVEIGLEPDGNGRVLKQAGLGGELHLFDEVFRVVDRAAFAVAALGDEPTAEGGEIVGLGVRLVGGAHGQAVGLERGEGIAGDDVEENGVGGGVGGARRDGFADGILDGDGEFVFLFVQHKAAEELTIAKATGDEGVALIAELAGDEEVVVGVDGGQVLDLVLLRSGTAPQHLRLGEFFPGEESGLVDHPDAGDAHGESALVDDGEAERGEGLLVVNC